MTEKTSSQRPKIGLVLGGGGSRGIAHIGVLEVLDLARIPIDFVVGTSMGAIIGVLYALGISPHQLAGHMIDQMESSTFFNMNIFSARSRQKTLKEQLATAVGDKTFSDLQIPVTVMAVDMLNGTEVPISQGPLLPAVLASSAMPAVFPPVTIDGVELADGGVIDSLATHVAYNLGADKIIAVDVYPQLEQEDPWINPLNALAGIDLTVARAILPDSWAKTPSMAASLWRASRVMTWYLHEKRLQEFPPDILLRPAVESYSSLDFKDVRGPIMAGIAAAEKSLDAIKALIPDSSTPE